MKDFEKLFYNFILEYNELGFEQLKSNKTYAELSGKASELMKQLEANLGEDARPLWNEYSEIKAHIRSMEDNNAFLNGVTLQAKLLRFFNFESTDFIKFSGMFIKV